MAINQFETEFQAAALTDFGLQNIVNYLYQQGLKIVSVKGINSTIQVINTTMPFDIFAAKANTMYFVDFCWSKNGLSATGTFAFEIGSFSFTPSTSGIQSQFSQSKKVLGSVVRYTGSFTGGAVYLLNFTGYEVLTAPLTP